MYCLRCILFLLFLLSTFDVVKSQRRNPYTSDIKKLNDDNLKRLIEEAQQRGMSIDDAIRLAKERGATDRQVSKYIDSLHDKILDDLTDKTSISKEKEFFKEIVQKAEFSPTDKNIQVFGFDFFNSEKLSFTPAISVPVSDTYILGYGDQIIIDVYGHSQQTYESELTRNGSIIVPQIGPIYIGGLTFKDAKNQISEKLRTIYQGMNDNPPNTFSNISLGELKGINVNVIGETNVPGTYTLPAGATAFTALYLSGGPNENGSFRKIDIIRAGKIINTIDVYKYLIEGDIRENIQLRDQDVVLVRPYKNRITLEGEFKRVGFFEAIDGETVADIIRFSGGFTENAYTHRLGLSRSNTRTKSYKDVTPGTYSSTLIMNGDILTAGEIVDRYENRVRISGAVYRPGTYEFTPGMNLKDLIKKAEGLKEDAFLERGLIMREDSDLRLQSIPFSLHDIISNGKEDTFLQKEDSIVISSVLDITEKRIVTISGDVISPGVFDYAENMTISDLIFLADGFNEKADITNIEVARRLDNNEKKYVTDSLLHIFEIKVDRNLELSDKDFVLSPFDRVYVRQAPGFRPHGTVTIEGAVKSPGIYGIQSKYERISDILLRGGNITVEAYAQGASLRRKRILSEAEYQAKIAVALQDTTVFTDTANIDNIEYYTVGIHLKEILANPRGKQDLFVKDGDKLFIPELLQTVNVSGAVLSPVSLVYNKKLRLKEYINLSGGFTQNAKKNKVFVMYPDGTAASTKGFIFRKYPKVQPGSEIVVIEKSKVNTLEQTRNWISLSTGLASIAASIALIVSVTK